MMWKPVIALSMLLAGSAVNAEELIVIDVNEAGYGSQQPAREALPKAGYGNLEIQREAATTGYGTGTGGTLIPNKDESTGGYKTTSAARPVVIDIGGGYIDPTYEVKAERRGTVGTGTVKTGYSEEPHPIIVNKALPDPHQKDPQDYPKSELKTGVSLPLLGWLWEYLYWRRVPGPTV